MSYNQELKRWREERDVTIDSQKLGLVSNLLEEITEVSRAQDLFRFSSKCIRRNRFRSRAY